jgi:hypothetical protein
MPAHRGETRRISRSARLYGAEFSHEVEFSHETDSPQAREARSAHGGPRQPQAGRPQAVTGPEPRQQPLGYELLSVVTGCCPSASPPRRTAWPRQRSEGDLQLNLLDRVAWGACRPASRREGSAWGRPRPEPSCPRGPTASGRLRGMDSSDFLSPSVEMRKRLPNVGAESARSVQELPGRPTVCRRSPSRPASPTACGAGRPNPASTRLFFLCPAPVQRLEA